MDLLFEDLSRYLGIPFVPRGRDRSGTDCYGLVWMVYRDELGIELPRYEGACELGREPAEIQTRIDANLGTDQWVEIQQEELQVGDVIFIHKLGFTHCGISIGAKKMIHMHKSGVVIEDLDRLGKGRIEACFRHRSLLG